MEKAFSSVIIFLFFLQSSDEDDQPEPIRRNLPPTSGDVIIRHDYNPKQKQSNVAGAQVIDNLYVQVMT